MADFGRMARGIATGYLSAKIANTEANDRLKEDILKRTGENFYSTTLPEFQKKETNRKDTYNKLKSRFNPDIAEYMDQSGFITGSASDYDDILTMLSDNDGFNEAKLKSYLEATKAGTYGERAEKRFKSIQDQENFIMNNMTKNGFGTNTIKNQLGLGMAKEEPTEPMAPAAATVETPTADTDTTTTKLPTFEEIFGVERGVDKVYRDLGREDKVALSNRALAEFNSLFKDELTGAISVTPSVKDSYNRLSEDQKKSKTLNEYAFDDFFRNRFLPKQGYTYEKTLPAEIVEAKQLINQYRSIGDDETVKIIKQRLIEAGFDIRDYNL
jgi:hypothetical protein